MDEELLRQRLVFERLDIKLDLAIEIIAMIDEKIDRLREEMDQRFAEIEYQFEVLFNELDEKSSVQRKNHGGSRKRSSIGKVETLGVFH